MRIRPVGSELFHADGRTDKHTTQISNFMRIRPVGSELFHADGRTDKHTESDSRF